MSTNTKLAEALAQFEAALLFAYPAGARGAAFDCWNKARQALAAHDAEQEPVAWRVWRGDSYELFFNEEAAKRRCECFIRKGKPEPLYAAPTEQAAQAVPAGFKWVPVEPTEDMLTAAVREDDKAFVDGMPHGATAADVWAVMLSAAPRPGAVAGWQPIETAPKDGSLFLCWVEAVQYGENDEGQQYQIDVSQVDFCQWQSHDDAPDGGWFEPCCGHISDHQRVTHWMPLPAAPQEPTHD